MAGYRRFIAYVYEYRKGKKQSNCGFIKVEVRNDVCTMEIHLHVEGVAAGEECKVYGFVRKEGLLNGILIGSCLTKKDWIECLLETDGTNLGGSGIALGKIGGMILTTQSGGFYGTEWDDQAIRPENFKEMAVAAERGAQEAKIKEVSEQESFSEENGVVCENQASCENQFPQKEQVSPDTRDNLTLQKDPANPVKQLAEPETTYKSELEPTEEKARSESAETNPKPESTLTEKSEPKSDSERTPVRTEVRQSESEPESSVEKESIADPEFALQPADDISSENPPSPEPESGIVPTEVCQNKYEPTVEKESMSQPAMKSEKVIPPPQKEKASSERQEGQPLHIQSTPIREGNNTEITLPFGQPFCPFADSDLRQCWKITPQDLVHFPRRQCALRNNRFLQYGYYNFGHLLLCRRQNGRYILGVPGSYDQQEQFMAGMFGFSCFKESSQIKVKKGKGGYWYRAIDPPVCR